MKHKLIRVEALLENSQTRVLSLDLLRPDPTLIAQGWERRFTADEQRASEAIELYEKLGFEVRAEPVRPEEFDHGCGDCRTVAFHFFAIYTRRKSG